MPVQDQAVWKSVTVVTHGSPQSFHRGDLLPPPAGDAESNQRALLRLGGALRVVEVVYTPDELRARGQGGGQSPAQAGVSAGLAAAVAPAPGADPRQPAAPVVLGPKPPDHGTKGAWKEYAVSQGMPAAEAESMTRDALAAHYRDAN
jgi:hypothetical protein